MNPILSRINNQQNNLLNLASQIKNGNPNVLYQQMLNNNPQFRQFVEQNKGKTIEQIANENGIDVNALMQIIK